MPFDVNVRDLDAALAVVEGADAPNGGLAIDTWHMAKLGIDAGRPAARSRRGTSAGSSSPTASTRTCPTSSTRPSTTGSCPARASSRSATTSPPAASVGYEGPWGVEVLSEELRNLPIEQIFDRSTRRAARSSPPSGKERECLSRPGPRPADLDVHADAADPRVRGAGEADLRGAPRRDPGPHASRRRRGGVDRRLARGDRPGRPACSRPTAATAIRSCSAPTRRR